MLKSIVVALDGSSSSANARRLAMDVARRTGASLVGLGVLDEPWITAPRAMPIGGGAYQAHRNEELLSQGRVKIEQRVSDFHAECQAASLNHSAIGAAGDPVEQIDAEADRPDLRVPGRQPNFHGADGRDIRGTACRLLTRHQRPLMVAPEGDNLDGDPEKVVVAFDGSVTSSRAMHMFLLLGLADGREVHVVSVDSDEKKADGLAERGAALFRSHGLKVKAHGVHLTGRPSAAILGAVASVGAGRLVMGAHGPPPPHTRSSTPPPRRSWWGRTRGRRCAM